MIRLELILQDGCKICVCSNGSHTAIDFKKSVKEIFNDVGAGNIKN